MTACSIHQEEQICEKKGWQTYNDDIMASLHKYKIAARDSMLGSDVSTSLLCCYAYEQQHVVFKLEKVLCEMFMRFLFMNRSHVTFNQSAQSNIEISDPLVVSGPPIIFQMFVLEQQRWCALSRHNYGENMS